jgi:hypothetical protein
MHFLCKLLIWSCLCCLLAVRAALAPSVSTTTVLNGKRAKSMKPRTLICIFALILGVSPAATARVGSGYDGAWNLLFVTQRGTCDPTYNFSVNISQGLVSHPNLVRFKGKVAASGSVRASVTMGDKYAAGSGKLTESSGWGTWSGRVGGGRCSGYWTAQRF